MSVSHRAGVPDLELGDKVKLIHQQGLIPSDVIGVVYDSEIKGGHRHVVVIDFGKKHGLFGVEYSTKQEFDDLFEKVT